ncbi:MAG: hypothetical protein GXY55_14040 [Phycisphaerae bacterium]|nr:hypothetical protein [Phycisphaerae bacterium]
MEFFGRFADVIGVGIAPIDGGYGLKINLRHAPPPSITLPSHIDGVPVRVEVARTSRGN